MDNVAGPSNVYAVRSDRKTAGNTSTGAVNGTFVDIPFETNDLLVNPTPGFISKPTVTEFQLAFPGIYRCTYALTGDPPANETGWESRAVLNGTPVPQSTSRATGRNIAQENNTIGRNFVFQVTSANSILKIQAAPTEGVAVNIVPLYSTCMVELARLT